MAHYDEVHTRDVRDDTMANTESHLRRCHSYIRQFIEKKLSRVSGMSDVQLRDTHIFVSADKNYVEYHLSKIDALTSDAFACVEQQIPYCELRSEQVWTEDTTVRTRIHVHKLILHDVRGLLAFMDTDAADRWKSDAILTILFIFGLVFFMFKLHKHWEGHDGALNDFSLWLIGSKHTYLR